MRLKQVKCWENPFFNSTIDSRRKLCPPDQVKFNCFDGVDVGHLWSTRLSEIPNHNDRNIRFQVSDVAFQLSAKTDRKSETFGFGVWSLRFQRLRHSIIANCRSMKK